MSRIITDKISLCCHLPFFLNGGMNCLTIKRSNGLLATNFARKSGRECAMTIIIFKHDIGIVLSGRRYCKISLQYKKQEP